MTTFFTLCLLVIPWVIIPLPGIADPFRIPKSVFFDLICLGMIYLSLARGFFFNYKNKYLSWFTLWVFITIFINWFLPFSLTFNNRQTLNFWAIEPIIHFILALWLSYIALCVFDKEDFLRIAKTLCISASLVSVFCIMQKVGLDPFGKVATYNHDRHISAFLDNPNLVGNYLVLCFPFFFLFKEKKYWVGLGLTAITIFLAHSYTSIVALFVGILVFMFLSFRNKKTVILLSILAVVSGIFLFSNLIIPRFNIGFSDRFLCWQETLKHIKENPLFGQGMGIFNTFNVTIKNSKWFQVHNDWLERVLELGVLGVFLMSLVIINSLRNFTYKIDNKLGFVYLSSFIIFLVLMLGSFPMEIAPLALLGLIDWWGVEKL